MIKTNKAKLLTLTFQGQVAPAQVVRTYPATWDGRIETGSTRTLISVTY